MTVVHRGRWVPADRVASRYQYLPVDLPAGADGIGVRLRYDRSGGGVLDLGCFAPDGTFRGWSGGARAAYAVGVDRATPGYLPGPLEPGTWLVVLGLHRVPPGGVEYEVTATTGRDLAAIAAEVGADLAEPPPTSGAPAFVPARPRRPLPAAPGLRWLAGDLHAHTVHSDGALELDALAGRAARNGLDYLAVTDHNTTSHHPHLAASGRRTGIALLPGQEVTTEFGHANAFGDIGWIDFRRPADVWVAETERRGGLLSINHPLAADLAWRQPLRRRPPLAEVWHWSWLDTAWGGPLAWWLAWGSGTVPVGGSDFHGHDGDRNELGTPTTWVACEAARVDDGDVVGAVLAGLRAGRTAITSGVAAPALLRVGDELVALGADGLLLAEASGRRSIVRGETARLRPAGPGPYRLETDRNATIALSPQ